MKPSSKKGVVHFVNSLVRNGLRYVVCSPGSRNAPLVITFDAHPEISTYVIHDERSAGFYALGIALATGEPVAVCCTSGSAVVNYFPAVTEAFYQSVPLVVISADRPERLINQGDGQTIMQEGVFGKHIMAEAKIDENETSKEKMNQIVEEVLRRSNGNWKGAVHFNIAFEEPLYRQEPEEVVWDSYLPKEFEQVSLKDDQLQTLLGKLDVNKRVLIFCGQMKPNDRVKNILSTIADHPNCSVLVENTSNLIDKKFNHCVDRTLASISEQEKQDFVPDVLITLGGAVISKRIKKFFRENQPKEHWRVGYEFPEMDTYFCKIAQIEMPSADFLEALRDALPDLAMSNYAAKWKQKDYLNQEVAITFAENAPLSDLKVVYTVLDFIPDKSNVHLANSTVVRYAQLFDPVAGLTYLSNRGTSGIDGSTSTACGYALANSNSLNFIITGDVSFFYDSNALWSSYVGANVKIILLNNEGGGIFRIIDGPDQTPQLEKYFEANHKTSAEHLCLAYGVNYLRADNLSSFEDSIAELIAIDNAPALLEVFTPREENATVLKDYFKNIIV
jgi:2-succinyl-5-enolpyruvyl-6-hydroxy-3-cyclohexene-1-carboxylate synthase